MLFDKEFPCIFVYCFFCRHLAQLGLRQLGLPVPKDKNPETELNPVFLRNYTESGLSKFGGGGPNSAVTI